MNRRIAALIAVASTSLWLTACGGGGGGGGIEGTGAQAQGTLRMAITDAPSCGYDAVHITIDRVRVNMGADTAETDAGWSEIVLSPPKRVDLLTLSNGVLEPLGQTTLPAGKYTQMRLVLAPNTAADPLANSVTPTGGAETPLTTPSAQQSGLKVKTDIDVGGNQTVDYAIDFDACKSIVKRGNSGQYNLKPVITVVPVGAATGMRVTGYVAPAIALGSTLVSVQSNGVPVKATAPDSSGRFVLYPVPVGNYDLVVSAPGRVTAVMTGVPVTSSAVIDINTAALTIDPPTSSMRSVSGSVSPTTATVRFLQSFGSGLTFEAAWAGVDAASGTFSLSVPTGAPVRVAYLANTASFAFLPDASAAAKYTAEALSNGMLKTAPLDASRVVPPVNFTFP